MSRIALNGDVCDGGLGAGRAFTTLGVTVSPFLFPGDVTDNCVVRVDKAAGCVEPVVTNTNTNTNTNSLFRNEIHT